MSTASRLRWRGVVVGVQPRIRLVRSYDERSHSYLGYTLTLQGVLGEGQRDLKVAVGEAAHAKHALRPGDTVGGMGVPVVDERLEAADLYKVSALEVFERAATEKAGGPPWQTLAPSLPVYRERGHRRLDAMRYAESCSNCVWGCLMPVEIITDHWKPHLRSYRRETFCYGPLSCRLYKAGPRRRVRGRKGMVYEEPDWVDDEAVAGRKDTPDS